MKIPSNGEASQCGILKPRGYQRLLERLEAENAQLRRSLVNLMAPDSSIARWWPDVAATWPVFDDDASAKTRLHDANSDWMKFSERTAVAQLPRRQKIFGVTGDDEGLAVQAATARIFRVNDKSQV